MKYWGQPAGTGVCDGANGCTTRPYSSWLFILHMLLLAKVSTRCCAAMEITPGGRSGSGMSGSAYAGLMAAGAGPEGCAW